MESFNKQNDLTNVVDEILKKDPTIDPCCTFYMFNGTLPYEIPGTLYIGFGFPITPICHTVLAKLDIFHVVNMTESNEANQEQYLQRMEKNGITSYSIPIHDCSVPTMEQIEEVYSIVKPLVDTGKKVGFHCRKGLGRTAVMIASMMVKDGYTDKKSIEKVTSAKSGTFVTLTQEIFVSKLSRFLNGN